jgi:hypothetical protein
MKREGTRKKLDMTVTICNGEGNIEVLVFNRIITSLRLTIAGLTIFKRIITSLRLKRQSHEIFDLWFFS